jgi:lysophospholipase L1-like esterase
LAAYIDAIDASTPGCGILVGTVTLGDGTREDKTPCGGWPDNWTIRVNKDQPDLSIIMIGAWDILDLTLSDTGQTLAFGSGAWDANFRNQLIKAIAILGAPQRAVALALSTCYRPYYPNNWYKLVGDERGRHLNDLMVETAASYASGVYIVDPPAAFCTDEAVATDTSYRADGVHYTAKGAALYFRTLLPQIMAPAALSPPTSTEPTASVQTRMSTTAAG